MDAQGQAGGRETVEGGVILRFPGDWVGPLEELVPFGPSADRESSSGEPDFWGEDSAVLQDALEMPHAVEVPESLHPARRQPFPFRRWLLGAGAVLAAALFAVAAVLGGRGSTAPHVRAVPFTVASIPPLASTTTAVKRRRARHRSAFHPQRHRRSTPPTTASTNTAAATTAASPVTTPAPTYHPAPASSSSAGNSSQSGGAFTLGGP